VLALHPISLPRAVNDSLQARISTVVHWLIAGLQRTFADDRSLACQLKTEDAYCGIIPIVPSHFSTN
jgi:hypothetical protein